METNFKPMNGFVFLFVILIAITSAVALLVSSDEQPVMILSGVLIIIISMICTTGLFVINPNESVVLTLFGKYKGTVKENGFCWVNPFMIKRKISLRARNLDSEPIKVNDKLGNPIMIGVVLLWKVEDTFKAAFDVDNYEHFVKVQSESAIRKLAGSFAYDDIDEKDESGITLRGGGDEVNHLLEKELSERLHKAGIKVIESRISYLAYAQEIAGAMLRRQQATAIVSARYKIVEGAVSMVKMALNQLSEQKIIELDDDKKASMISNLMVVLCSDKDASPIVNTGSIY
ncbi:MAG: hypothetical protein A2046_13520 [Bacteroidetes bacterium GWA2_30_7]|nr:MAG: hypothetical protein A2046_13520 [Bacteroidetes bacterium GWA2_30_7]